MVGSNCPNNGQNKPWAKPDVSQGRKATDLLPEDGWVAFLKKGCCHENQFIYRCVHSNFFI